MKKNLLPLILSILFSFLLFHNLFNSYFEADEWPFFTYYLPLTQREDGALDAVLNTFTKKVDISGGLHVIPLSSEIFFLNTKIFGLNYEGYAFMSILIHGVNIFLVFSLIKTLLKGMEKRRKNLFAILGSVFFGLCTSSVHAVTGAAPFYGQNILSVTFFLLCIISFKYAFEVEKKRFIYITFIFLLLALLSKESTAFLFILLPFITFLEPRIFKIKFLVKIYILFLLIYTVFRFLLPNFYTLPGHLANLFVVNYIPKSYTTAPKQEDTGTIVSRDLSIYKNLPAEIIFRSITFPIKITGTLFIPRATSESIVKLITPIVYPLPPVNVSQDESQISIIFALAAGVGFFVYSSSLILLLIIFLILKFQIKRKRIIEAKALCIGLAIILASALPLVAIIFAFPRWGYDTYFDNRLYYNPSVGAAVVFPFLLVYVSQFIAKNLKIRSVKMVGAILFLMWFWHSLNILNSNLHYIVEVTGVPRRKIVEQMKSYLPSLPQKAVFYIETDGKGAYGPVLPFQTSVPQAITVFYYDINHLPDVFFNEPLFNNNQQGYKFIDGRGFGYYTSKEKLSADLSRRKFSTQDIYAFYYNSQTMKIKNITDKIREQMQKGK